MIVPITFNGIDITVFYFPNDGGMIRLPVKSVFRPIIEDNHSRRRFCRTVKPLSALLKPIYAGGSPCVFWNNARVNIATFVSTPRDKATAPLNTRTKTVPSPIRLAAFVTELRKCNRNNILAACSITVQNSVPHLFIFIR